MHPFNAEIPSHRAPTLGAAVLRTRVNLTRSSSTKLATTSAAYVQQGLKLRMGIVGASPRLQLLQLVRCHAHDLRAHFLKGRQPVAPSVVNGLDGQDIPAWLQITWDSKPETCSEKRIPCIRCINVVWWRFMINGQGLADSKCTVRMMDSVNIRSSEGSQS